ncbi:hypothetical protein [Micromonospora aurantiaca (nom. illeg.)]|uniref:hypothetical protein n=1 Tax=Micromonospora aurantiaca (nom. illeg.) TaxID=47850 RepID=UPI003EBFF191
MSAIEIPTELLDIAAVVTGEQRITLTGWQLDTAITAMVALGHSTRHIAYSLNRSEASVRKRAEHLGVRLNRYDQRPDWTAIDMVVAGDAQMHLLGVDRREAIRAMAARGIDSIEMGRRLKEHPENVRKLAKQIGAPIARATDGTWERLRRNQPARRRQQVAA